MEFNVQQLMHILAQDHEEIDVNCLFQVD